MPSITWRDIANGMPVHYIASSSGICHPSIVVENWTIDDLGAPESADIIQQDTLSLGLPLRRNGVACDLEANTADTFHPRDGCPRNTPL